MTFPNLLGEHRTEAIPPKSSRLVADVDAPLEQNILDLSQRKRIADIHHHRQADHLGRAVEITEGFAHRRRLRNLAKRLKPIYSDNAMNTYCVTDSFPFASAVKPVNFLRFVNNAASLMIRGTLCWPPSWPRLFIQAAKRPGAITSIIGARKA